MVFTSWPSAITVSVVQDFTALPSTCTTQAPHCEVSQPTWVPVSRNCSRSNCTSKVRVSTSAVTGLPFTVRETAAMGSSYEYRSNVAIFPAMRIAGILPGRNLCDLGRFPHPGTIITLNRAVVGGQVGCADKCVTFGGSGRLQGGTQRTDVSRCPRSCVASAAGNKLPRRRCPAGDAPGQLAAELSERDG